MMLPYNEHAPTYDLRQLQWLVGQGELSRVISYVAAQGANELDFSREDIVEAILSLEETHFYKSMESERISGLWQDVYHLWYRGVHLYVKLQVDMKGRAVVIQFKRK
jgi:hypothetical protein